MPSGITEDIYQGKDVSPQDFMARVGRQMGMFIHQRDDSHDAPLRYPAKPGFDGSNYHKESLDKVKKSKVEWEAKTEEQKYAEWSAYYRTAMVKQAEAVAKDAELRQRYTSMIAKIQAFDLTNEPLMESTKDSAIRYLNDSLAFDCGGEVGKYYQPKEYVVWCDSKVKSYARDLSYYQGEIDRNVARNIERDKYIDSFVRAFGVEVLPARS